MEKLIFAVFGLTVMFSFQSYSEECVDKTVKFRADECRSLLGCARNSDGTFSPRKASCACSEKGCEKSESDYVPVDLTNGKCVKTSVKGKKDDVCGSFFGCTQNSDLTYSPNYAPCVCEKNGCKKEKKTLSPVSDGKAQ